MASREIKQLDNLMDGAVAERFNAELKKIWANIFDHRTSPTKPRAFSLKFVFTPNVNRDAADMTYEVTTKLAAPEAMKQMVMMRQRDDGTVVVTEHTDQIPGQMDMDGNEQPEPTIAQFNDGSQIPAVVEFRKQKEN